MKNDISPGLMFVLFFVWLLVGVMIGSLFNHESMKKESLKGFKAFPSYYTNDLGEVSIVKIEWRKQ